MSDMPPLFEIEAFDHQLRISELDWALTGSKEADLYAFTYGWVRAFDVQPLVAEIARLRAEVLEQARLLGMSGEREAKLRARVEVLEMALRRIQATPHPSVAAQCAGCYSHQKTATYALEDAAP